MTFTPMPEPSELTAPFWRSGVDGRLRLQRCSACGHLRYPVSSICPQCLDPGYIWEPLSGRGTVHSYAVFHRAYHTDWADAVPYLVALIELDEGPVMLSNIIGVAPDEARVGQRVRVTYERVSNDAALPQFRPMKEPA